MPAKILIVEDEAITAMDIQKTLESAGFEVVSTASMGKEAIQKAGELKPDLILMDITLKGKIDGIVVADKIMTLFDIPVIYLTAFSDEETFKRAKLTKPYGFITKPLNHKELRASIEIALYKHDLDKKLKESEVRYRSLYENSFDAILMTKPDGSILSANPTACLMFDMTEEELKKSGREGVVVEDNQLNHVLNERVEKSKSKVEIIFKRKNGSTFIGEVTSSFFTDVDGTVKTSMIIRDISERKKIEEELRESHDGLELKVKERTKELEKLVEDLKLKEYLLDSANDSIFLHDLEGNIIYVNDAAYKSRGYTKDELLGMNIGDLSPPEFNEQIDQQIAEIKMHGEFIFEAADLHKDGSIILVEIHSRAIKLDDKYFILSVVRDITEKKKAEAELKEAYATLKKSEMQYKTLTENSIDFITRYDTDFKIIYSNKAIKSIGLLREDLIGKTIDELWVEKDTVNLWRQSLQKALITAEIQFLEFNLQGFEELRIFSSYIIPEINDRKIKSLLVVTRDITKRKQTEETLKETILELKRSNEELERFAYVSSHDLQEPLRTIASFTQLLERRYKGKFDSDADEFMDYIVEAAIRMKEQIEGLLEYSRVSTKGKEFKLVDTNVILNQTIGTLNTSIKGSNTEITVEDLPTVMGDSDQLYRVFQNLISNSIKFRKCEEPAKIHIEAFKDDENNEYVFSVQDNGIGIEPQYAERIFVIFQRLHTRNVYKGTGIGLSIVKKIIEHHGGRIWVESEFGKGSTFYFTLPKS